MMTPGGHQMSVAMTNCGSFGWVTDRTGYRYEAGDPLTGMPWPAMPPLVSGAGCTGGGSRRLCRSLRRMPA